MKEDLKDLLEAKKKPKSLKGQLIGGTRGAAKDGLLQFSRDTARSNDDNAQSNATLMTGKAASQVARYGRQVAQGGYEAGQQFVSRHSAFRSGQPTSQPAAQPQRLKPIKLRRATDQPTIKGSLVGAPKFQPGRSSPLGAATDNRIHSSAAPTAKGAKGTLAGDQWAKKSLLKKQANTLVERTDKPKEVVKGEFARKQLLAKSRSRLIQARKTSAAAGTGKDVPAGKQSKLLKRQNMRRAMLTRTKQAPKKLAKGTIKGGGALLTTFGDLDLDPDNSLAPAQKFIRGAQSTYRNTRRAKKAAKWSTKALKKVYRNSGRITGNVFQRLSKSVAQFFTKHGVALATGGSIGIPLLGGFLVLAIIVAIIGTITPASMSTNIDELDEAKAYLYLTQLDADATKEATDDAAGSSNQLYINGEESTTKGLELVSDFDKILAYESFKGYDSYLKPNSNQLKSSVKSDLKKMHDQMIKVSTAKKTQVIKTTKTVTNAKTGKRKRTTTSKTLHITRVNVKTMEFDDWTKKYTDASKDTRERLDAMDEVGEYVVYQWMQNPNASVDDNEVTISNRMGYRYRNGKVKLSNGVTIQTAAGDPIRAVTSGKVTKVSDSMVKIKPNSQDGIVTYSGLKAVKVKKGQKIGASKVIGSSKSKYVLSFHAPEMVDVQKKRSAVAQAEIHAGDTNKNNNVPDTYTDTEVIQNYLNPAFELPEVSYTYGTSYQLTDAEAGGMVGDLINPPAKVTRWRKLVTKYAKMYGISQYVNLLLSFIWEESGGDDSVTKDITQSSESLGLPPNSIKTVDQSIKQMCANFAGVLHTSRALGLSDSAAIGARNYGGAYLTWLHKKKQDDSFDNMVAFAKLKSGGKKVAYTNPIAKSFGSWRYKYGNMFYTKLVLSHIRASSSAMVDIAKKEVKASNKGGKKFWSYMGFKSRVEWCACFVSWVAHQAKMDAKVPHTASCQQAVSWFKSKHKWHSPTNYTPKSGDIIYFNWSGNRSGVAEHTGIVDKVTGNTVHTVEGNSSNTVRLGTYPKTSKFIYGYGSTN